MVLLYNKFFANPTQKLFLHSDFTQNVFTFAALNTPHNFLSFTVPPNVFAQIYCEGVMQFDNNSQAGAMTFQSQIAGLANSINELAYINMTATETTLAVHTIGMGSLQAGGVVSLSGLQQFGAAFGNGRSLGFFVWAIV